MNRVTVCDGCNVRQPWEHRCHGGECTCNSPSCMVQQGRMTHEELMAIVNADDKQSTASMDTKPLVSSSTTSDGHCRLKDNVWWYCEYGKLRGPVLKGYSRRIRYKWKILNDDMCKTDGQRVSVVRDGKSSYCVIL